MDGTIESDFDIDLHPNLFPFQIKPDVALGNKNVDFNHEPLFQIAEKLAELEPENGGLYSNFKRVEIDISRYL